MVLTGCTIPNNQIVRTEYVKQQIPDPPSPPDYYPVTFTIKDGYYRLDPENAKALLKNRELDKGYQGECTGILTNLKEGSK